MSIIPIRLLGAASLSVGLALTACDRPPDEPRGEPPPAMDQYQQPAYPGPPVPAQPPPGPVQDADTIPAARDTL
jgi:hypothetical protein